MDEKADEYFHAANVGDSLTLTAEEKRVRDSLTFD